MQHFRLVAPSRWSGWPVKIRTIYNILYNDLKLLLRVLEIYKWDWRFDDILCKISSYPI